MKTPAEEGISDAATILDFKKDVRKSPFDLVWLTRSLSTAQFTCWWEMKSLLLNKQFINWHSRSIHIHEWWLGESLLCPACSLDPKVQWRSKDELGKIGDGCSCGSTADVTDYEVDWLTRNNVKCTLPNNLLILQSVSRCVFNSSWEPNFFSHFYH